MNNKLLPQTLIALAVFAFGAQAYAANCSASAGRHALTKAVGELSNREIARGVTAKVSDIKLVRELESFPSLMVYEVLIDTTAPGWKKFEVSVQSDNCQLRMIDEIDSE